MNRIWKFLRSLDWRVLFAVPVLAVLLGVANNLRVSEDQRVRWSGERLEEGSPETARGARRGAWTSDFDAATNAAAAAHLPVVVAVTQRGCPYCARLHKALKGVAVRSWQKERGWYFVSVARESNPQATDFVVSTPVTNTVAPYVGGYWTRADGTQTLKNFPGRPGQMGVRKEKSLALEWMRAVEAALPGAPGLAGGTSAASFVRRAKMPLAVAADKERGAEGLVRMSPAVSFLKEGQKAVLAAEARPGSVLAGWRYPDGRFVTGKSRLTVDTSWPEGTYSAVFRKPENCAAPALRLPEQEVVWQEWRRERFVLRVNADAYPVTFGCRGLPAGMALTSRAEGVISGTPQSNGVFRVEVTAKGASSARPPATGAFTVRVLPRPTSGAADDDDAEESDEVN